MVTDSKSMRSEVEEVAGRPPGIVTDVVVVELGEEGMQKSGRRIPFRFGFPVSSGTLLPHFPNLADLVVGDFLTEAGGL